MTDARLWHPWVRVQRILRTMLTSRWDAASWKEIKQQIRSALAEQGRIERAGWFN